MSNEKKTVQGVNVGDEVEAKLAGCNISAVTGKVIQNDARCCVIDTGDRVKVYESSNGQPARPREVELHAYIFGDVKATVKSPGAAVTKM